MAINRKIRLSKSVKPLYESVFISLEALLARLDETLEFKLYSFYATGGSKKPVAVELKRVLGQQEAGNDRMVVSEDLSGVEAFLDKGGLTGWSWDGSVGHLQRHIDALAASNWQRAEGTVAAVEAEEAPEEPDEARLPETIKHSRPLPLARGSLLYANSFRLARGEARDDIIFLLVVDYASSQLKEMFYEKPHLSFLRVTFDNYFEDYYTRGDDGSVVEPLKPKYRESETQFLQRMTRLFIGKVRHIVAHGYDEAEQSVSDGEDLRHQYYMNRFLDDLEGIATRTYEGGSPFGCMLFINPALLKAMPELVQYTVQFDGDQGIPLGDGRRIRKLLEMTNNEHDLYLIADTDIIYGIGKIDWSLLGGNQLFKVEMKGLSRYNMLLVTTGQPSATDKHMETDTESKTYKMTTRIRIIAEKLVGISFQNPEVGRDDFDSEWFKRAALSVFARDKLKEKHKEPFKQLEKGLNELGEVIGEATRQQSGTMIVVAEPSVAAKETDRLQKQSTRIARTKLDSSAVKYLTAIDGAMYFDIEANCHAIGVILDGVANRHSGDASRGARFNSAHHYLEKLQSEGKACLIAVISEDGMVNLLPEPATEKTVRRLVGELVSCIRAFDRGERPEAKKAALELEKRLRQVGETVPIDEHHYLLLGTEWHKQDVYAQAIEYFISGIERSGKPHNEYRRELMLACYRHWRSVKKPERDYSLLDKLVEQADFIIEHSGKPAQPNDYNMRGIARHRLGEQAKAKEKLEMYNLALQDLTKSISMLREPDDILLQNRSLLLQSMGRYDEALDDLLLAEKTKPRERYKLEIGKLAHADEALLLHAVHRYAAMRNAGWRESELAEQLLEQGKDWGQANPEIAAALGELIGNDENPTGDE